jgi:hypothetical protein
MNRGDRGVEMVFWFRDGGMWTHQQTGMVISVFIVVNPEE